MLAGGSSVRPKLVFIILDQTAHCMLRDDGIDKMGCTTSWRVAPRRWCVAGVYSISVWFVCCKSLRTRRVIHVKLMGEAEWQGMMRMQRVAMALWQADLLPVGVARDSPNHTLLPQLLVLLRMWREVERMLGLTDLREKIGGDGDDDGAPSLIRGR
ncbi:uncharacterized protein LY79DRAFT_130410 [Colletotrichum navitas]|uniref:Uncharacterized protein n=1 Tax=Colletotrichum navitas TaxID=681940 RepID=A0AAD8PJ90_9PEZI|nr:uncharacterized protein LY79DRAFT_130410 [Colletotrichum navitas]KAK1564291.1 hypothetical protein LY79DRAFT_130410 [Colletotrichum navitas]